LEALHQGLVFKGLREFFFIKFWYGWVVLGLR